VADKLLAHAGGNEALAALAKAFDKPGYGPLQFQPGKPLALPKGFRYVRFGHAGTRMSDGLPTPTCHDGTGYFAAPGGTVRIVRNQEGFQNGRALGRRNAYDRHAQGGVTVSHFEPRSGRLLRSALVLNGTDNNCNGGATPWGTWLSGEENTVGRRQDYGAEHGYVFEVPARATETVEPVPIKAMGRFVHEACPVDARTGIVYQTEDNGDPGDGFYRYLPDHRGKLHRGGRLQMLAIKDRPKYNTVNNQKVGRRLECRWVDIPEPDPNGADEYPQAVYMQGRHAGGARFLGLEGGVFEKGSCYFTASDGGEAGQGQIWRYTPDNRDFRRGTLQLLFESPRNRVLSGPDAINLSPRGGIVVCEDGGGEDVDGEDNWIRGLTPDGRLFDFAKVTQKFALHDHIAADLFPYNKRRFERPPKKGQGVGASECAGIGYSPDGKWMFFHLQYPGETFAVTGPWERGWL
jgi:uncharacterized protein